MAGEDLEQYTFDDDGRMYTDHGDLWLPSVSTVLNVADDPPGLRNWKRRTTEEERRQKQFYTQNRGTLIHYYILDTLTDREMWSDDEQSSVDELKGRTTNEQLGLTGGPDTWDRFQEDKEWALDTWEMIQSVYDIRPENTLGVELFVKNTDVGYAGQFDLLSIDPDTSEVVLRDLKTSKRVYDKHLKQLEAYSHAVDISVDRLEVIRINPDQHRWNISRSDEWLEDRRDLWNEFCALREKLEQQKIDDLKTKITSDG